MEIEMEHLSAPQHKHSAMALVVTARQFQHWENEESLKDSFRCGLVFFLDSAVSYANIYMYIQRNIMTRKKKKRRIRAGLIFVF